MTKTDTLLQQIDAIRRKYEGIATITGENFNIFRILKIETREVRLHSALIAELLNPSGSHGQKDLFLKAFTQTVGIDDFGNGDLSNAEVRVEEVGEYGRIDIVIKSKSGKPVVIENKIFASDIDGQLAGYKKKYPSCHLLYLTLDGREPSKQSITDKEKYERLQKDKDYCTISYKETILSWLLKCRNQASDHPMLRETLTQYINLVKYLTHQTMNVQTKSEIVATILKNPENIETAENIANTWEAVKLKIIGELKPKIKEIANELNLLIEFDKDEKYILGKKESGFWFYKEGWHYCIYFYFINHFEDMHFGVHILSDGESQDSSFKDVLHKMLLTDVGDGFSNDHWLWATPFKEWSETSWKDVSTMIPVAIKENIEKIMAALEGFNDFSQPA